MLSLSRRWSVADTPFGSRLGWPHGWIFEKSKRVLFAAQLSTEQVIRAIQTFSPHDGTVVDPEAVQDARTLFAADALGRRWIGAHPDPDVCAAVIAAWEHHAGQPARLCTPGRI